jgi:hypothetical protein
VNTSTVRTVDFGNGTVSTIINGSLANGTTASGGTDPSDDSEDSDTSEVSSGMKLAMNIGGYWVMVATVILGMWMTT